MENLILIDTSYVSFYRFFAIIRWLSIAKSEEYKEHISNPKYKWIDDKIFMEKYEKMYIESIKKILGKKIFSNSQILFCMDSPKETVWRTTEIKCDYKGDRVDLSKKNDFKPVFKYTYQEIIPKIMKDNQNIRNLKVNNLEADDIIAIIIKYYEKINPNKKIYLISGDKDFLQLGRENIYFINFKIKKSVQYTKEEAKILLHKKILLGDKSDCITSIFPKNFSTSKKKELCESIEEFNSWIKENKTCLGKYQENEKLIDFKKIPENYTKHVIEEFIKLFNL